MKTIIAELLESVRSGTNELWESVRNRFTGLDRLNKILGGAGRTDMLDHFREVATGVPPPLDLPDDIVAMVCEMRDLKSLCEKVIRCKPSGRFGNFDKLQAAAPNLLAAMRLEASWATWHEYRETDDVRGYVRDVHQLLVSGTAVGFLLETMADFYFRISTYEEEPADFLQLFPPTDDWSPELVSSFQLMAAFHIATYFWAAAECGMPARPDLICRMCYLRRKLKKYILGAEDRPTLEHAAQYGFLQALIRSPEMIESEPGTENFYREQRLLHFSDFQFPSETLPDQVPYEEQED
jgi:hypothetical protein